MLGVLDTSEREGKEMPTQTRLKKKLFFIFCWSRTQQILGLTSKLFTHKKEKSSFPPSKSWLVPAAGPQCSPGGCKQLRSMPISHRDTLWWRQGKEKTRPLQIKFHTDTNKNISQSTNPPVLCCLIQWLPLLPLLWLLPNLSLVSWVRCIKRIGEMVLGCPGLIPHTTRFSNSHWK